MATVESTLPHIRQHLELFGSQASREAIAETGDDSESQRRNTEELVSLGIAFHRQLRRAALNAQDAIERKDVEYTPSISRDFSDLYRLWLVPFDSIEASVARLAAKGLQVKGFDKYRKLAIRVRLHCFDVDRMLEDRPARPLNESLHALRRDRG